MLSFSQLSPFLNVIQTKQKKQLLNRRRNLLLKTSTEVQLWSDIRPNIRIPKFIIRFRLIRNRILLSKFGFGSYLSEPFFVCSLQQPKGIFLSKKNQTKSDKKFPHCFRKCPRSVHNNAFCNSIWPPWISKLLAAFGRLTVQTAKPTSWSILFMSNHSISIWIYRLINNPARHEKSCKHASIPCGLFLRKLLTILGKLHICSLGGVKETTVKLNFSVSLKRINNSFRCKRLLSSSPHIAMCVCHCTSSFI